MNNPYRQDDGFTDAVIMIAVVCVIVLAVRGLWQLVGLTWLWLFG